MSLKEDSYGQQVLTGEALERAIAAAAEKVIEMLFPPSSPFFHILSQTFQHTPTCRQNFLHGQKAPFLAAYVVSEYHPIALVSACHASVNRLT
jgi:hypothetical protein